MMKLKYTIGKTVNLGNYENVKLEFGVEVTCEEENKEDVWEECKQFVQGKLEEEEYKWRN